MVAIDDRASPLFMHHDDNPCLLLVSQPLNGENYGSWSRTMKIALWMKNKFYFVDGLLPCPDPKEDLVQYQAWMRNNNMVISWILNVVAKEITPKIVAYEFTSDIWSISMIIFSSAMVNISTRFSVRYPLCNKVLSL